MNRGINTWKWRIVRLGLNQSSFSKKIGVSKSHFSKWVNFKEQPSQHHINLVEREILRLEILGNFVS